jgi:hypothetical protein
MLADQLASVGHAHLYADDFVAEHIVNWQADAWAFSASEMADWVVAKCTADLTALHREAASRQVQEAVEDVARRAVGKPQGGAGGADVN